MEKTFMIIALFFSLAITSCGNDDEKDYENANVKEKEPQTSTISEASKPFVGLWHLSTSTNNSDFPPFYLFLSKDGRAWVDLFHLNPYGSYDYLYHWNYNEKTQILSTDHNYASWQINLISDKSFSAFALWGKNIKPIYTAEYIDDKRITFPAINGIWVNADKDTLRFRLSSTHIETFSWSSNSYSSNLGIEMQGTYTHNKERYKFYYFLRNPSKKDDEYLFDREKELIKIVSNYNEKVSEPSNKEYECWNNLTIMNCFDFSNAYMDIDMCMLQEYADKKYVMVTKKGRYYRIIE